MDRSSSLSCKKLLLGLLVATPLLVLGVQRVVPLPSGKVVCTPKWNTAFTRSNFPSTFTFGTATAAYQIEGATASEGRGPCIWDEFVKLPGKIQDNDTADVADDSYSQWRRDVDLLKKLGVDSYRFSISWSRVFPNGVGEVNPLGVAYYNNIINALVGASITPAVTLYHWDLPLALDVAYGGWLNARSADDFQAYADFAFKTFGDRVKKWITFNEPQQTSNQGYANGAMAPGRCSDRIMCAGGNSSTEPYIVAHNILRSHAKAVDVYRKKYQVVQHGEIGITLDSLFYYPLNNLAESVAAAERGLLFSYGWFAHPVVYGDYPGVMRELVNDRLPTFTSEEKALLKGSVDFLGLNSYTGTYASQGAPPPPGGGSPYTDARVITSAISEDGEPIGISTASSWLKHVPKSIYSMALWIHRRYPGISILITENGTSNPGNSTIPLAEALCDTNRVMWYQTYLSNLLNAIDAGAPVQAFYAWSLMDNFEWARGYSERFGMHYVDFTDGARPRYPKMSATWYQWFLSI